MTSIRARLAALMGMTPSQPTHGAGGDAGGEDPLGAIGTARGMETLAQADRLRDSGSFAAAAQAYREALNYLPDRNDIRVQLGNMLKDSRQYAEAEAVYRVAFEHSPCDADILLQLGRALKLAGRTDDAIATLRKAIEISPDLDAAADELGRILPMASHAPDGPVRSSVSLVAPTVIAGWALDTRQPGQPVELEVAIDGVLFRALQADLERSDLRTIAPGVVGGGFEVVLPQGEGAVSVSVRHKGLHLRGSPIEVDLATLSASSPIVQLSKAPGCGPQMDPVAVILPVYDAPDDVTACLDALVRHTTSPARLIVIDDASPDPRIGAILARLEGIAGVEVVRNAVNLGYTRTVNRGIELAGRCDVVLLNSDTRVGPRWLEGMLAAARSGHDIASVTAVSDNAGAFTVPDLETPLPKGLALEDYQRRVTQAAGAFWPAVPTGNGFCMYMSRRAIDDVGAFDPVLFPRGYGEENDWSIRASRRGWRHLVDDRTLVAHKRAASFGASRSELMENARRVLDEVHPDYNALVAAFHTSAGLNAARYRVRRLIQNPDGDGAPRPARPRVLFVISTGSGGTPYTNRDLMAALADRYEPWLLTSNARELALFRVAAGPDGLDVRVACAALPEPMTLVEHRSRDYDRIVARWLVQHAIELVHVRHLAWHSMDLPAVAQGLGIPVVLSFHDFYSVCPTIKLLDETMTYCGGRCTATAGDCRPELWRPAVMPPLKGRWVVEWRRRFAEMFACCDAFVTTDESARATLLDAFPSLAGRRFEVIAHGRDFARFEPPARHTSPLQRLTILVPGNISPAKGRDVIEALALRDTEGRLAFYVAGDVHPPLMGERIVCHGPYRRDELGSIAAASGAQIGAVFSIWSETYCHTLTEMWAAGLPVAGFDFGAVGERIRRSGAGWILPHADIDALYRRLVAVADDPAARSSAAERVAAWQQDEGRHRTCASMAEQYARLYAQLTAARLAFRRGPEPQAAASLQASHLAVDTEQVI